MMMDDGNEKKASRILIVEDEAILAEDIAQSLENLGFLVSDKTSTGEEAIKLAEALRPDLILMDIKLAGHIDGIEAADRIRACFDIPVVYLSAYTDEDLLDRAKRTEPYGYLGKPVMVSELRSAIETALYKHQADKRVRESEERFRSLIDQAADAIFVHDLNGRFLDVNRQACVSLGYTRDELLSMSVEDIDPDIESRKDNINFWPNLPVTFGARHKRKDGTTFPIEMRLGPIEYEGTEVVLGIARDISDRKAAEEALKAKETLLERILDASPVGINYVRNRHMVWSNRAWEKMFGFKHPDEYVGKSTRILYESDEEYERTGEAYHDAVKDDATTETDVTLLRTNGSVFDANVRVRFVEKSDSDVVEAVVAVSDISNRKMAEAEKEKLYQQLLQAQKMESVGRLAGGVAHDFNNILSAILGHVELAMMRSNPSEPMQARLKAIKESALRSTDLVRQLLAFARRQTVAPKVLDMNDTVAGLLNVLLRLMGEDIDLVWMPGARLWPVKIDPSQIDQILANLCVNARDAITGVGKITIETENKSFDDADCAVHPGFVCGDYVMLTVSDDGCGMNKEVLDLIFEPFFTTKGFGKGTGLGLATVYGIVKQNDGFINVYSEPAGGTTFRIYLPRFVGEALEPVTDLAPETPEGCGETVLLVEDDVVLLTVGREMLEQLGYKVLTAEIPSEALRQARAHATEIQLLITDVVMPEMNCRDLVKSMQDIIPSLKCLFTSGYTANVIAHHGVLDEGVQFLQKPYSLHELATKVREALKQE